jgi:hypothetical protein
MPVACPDVRPQSLVCASLSLHLLLYAQRLVSLRLRGLQRYRIINYPFKVEARLNTRNTEALSSYRKENTALHHYKDQLVNVV